MRGQPGPSETQEPITITDEIVMEYGHSPTVSCTQSVYRSMFPATLFCTFQAGTPSINNELLFYEASKEGNNLPFTHLLTHSLTHSPMTRPKRSQKQARRGSPGLLFAIMAALIALFLVNPTSHYL